MDSDSRIPIDKKLLLTIKEAAAYSNIGINRIDAMLREDGCPFVLYVGSKKLVKRNALSPLCDRAFLHLAVKKNTVYLLRK